MTESLKKTTYGDLVSLAAKHVISLRYHQDICKSLKHPI